MKKIISLLLSMLTVCTLALGMSGCGGASESAVVGVWNYVGESNPGTESFVTGQLYLYVYKDGTGDTYGKPRSMEDKAPYHMNSFEWHIDGEYFVRGTTKYTIDGDSMYNKQGKLVYTKVSNDTSGDIDIKLEF